MASILLASILLILPLVQASLIISYNAARQMFVQKQAECFIMLWSRLRGYKRRWYDAYSYISLPEIDNRCFSLRFAPPSLSTASPPYVKRYSSNQTQYQRNKHFQEQSRVKCAFTGKLFRNTSVIRCQETTYAGHIENVSIIIQSPRQVVRPVVISSTYRIVVTVDPVRRLRPY